MKDKVIAVILAAGQGKRMKSSIPKQYMMLNNKPLLYYSIKAFNESSVDEIILVVGEGEIEQRRIEYVDDYGFNKVKYVIEGGRERYNSVYRGLECVVNASYVLIHDGARPLVSIEIIENVIACVKEKKACITGMPSKDTVKVSDDNGYVDKTIDRNYIWMIQTPQAFSYELIYGAYEKIAKDSESIITDDSMAVELKMNHPVYIIEGSYRNIKVTTPEDLIIAEALLKKYYQA